MNNFIYYSKKTVNLVKKNYNSFIILKLCLYSGFYILNFFFFSL